MLDSLKKVIEEIKAKFEEVISNVEGKDDSTDQTANLAEAKGQLHQTLSEAQAKVANLKPETETENKTDAQEQAPAVTDETK